LKNILRMPADILNIKDKENTKKSKTDVLREQKDVMKIVNEEFDDIVYRSHGSDDFEFVISEPIKIDVQVN
jgi:hypothetical protein